MPSYATRGWMLDCRTEDGVDHSWGYGSDQRLREENQDCYGVFDFPEYTLAVVCDGMGGHVGGAHASTLAVRTIHDTMRELHGMPPAQALEEAIQRTNVVIYEASRKNHRLNGMGTTVVAAVIERDRCYLAHVGDSRAYLLRRGQASQMTRDHTMVNLFVDAELLSPEDAATHPEAHVLSRCLGIERQVDVELSDLIRLEPNDVVFLCSDGVHGIVADWEIANTGDWSMPHEATREILRLVSGREGDDNATGVAVTMGTSIEDVPPTSVPEPRRYEDAGIAPTGMTAVPVDEELDPQSSRGASMDGSAHSGGYVVYEDHPILEPQSEQRNNLARMEPPPPPTPQQTPASATTGKSGTTSTSGNKSKTSKTGKAAKPRVQRRGPGLILPLAFAASALFAVVCGVAALFVLKPPSGATASDGEVAELTPLPSPTRAVPATEPGAQPIDVAVADPQPAQPALPPEPAIVPSTATKCPVEGYLLKPDLPPPNRRLPHRAIKCTSSPPGGPDTQMAVAAARQQQCADSIAAVQAGMSKSIDHCTLYKSAWLCFNEVHEIPLEQVKSDSWGDLVLHLPHFEGTREEREAEALRPEYRGMPAWFLPAPDGLEYRLEAWTNDEQLRDFVGDLFGDQVVADQLAKDIHLEALTAAGLACVPPSQRHKALETAWARRVYVLTRALHGTPGALINSQREQLMPVLHGLLHDAVSAYMDEKGRTTAVPAEVWEAYQVGRGDRPPPNAVRASAPKPAQVEDPLIPDDPDVTINRGG